MRRSARLLAACAAAWASAGAAAESLDYAQALTRAQRDAGQVQGARLDAQAQRLKAEAVRNLGGPTASLSAFAGRVSTTFNLDLSSVAGVAGAVDSAFPVLNIPAIPNTVSSNRTFDLTSVGVNSFWPLYTGGRLEAIHGLANSKADEALAELQEVEDKQSTAVAQRYFSVQLARHALAVRTEALAAVAEHREAAGRLEAAGLIAKAERLKAEVALDGARRDLAKARSDVEIAQVALARLVGATSPVQPTTPLFVHLQSVGSLQSFIEAGMVHNPVWMKIASKREQAEQAEKVRGGEHAPTVVAVGRYDLNRSSDKLVQPNWTVGVLLSIPLFGGVDKAKLAEAGELDRQRVSASAQQAMRDVPTLIESQWRAMENARAHVASMASSIALARENLRLQQVSFENSQSTSLDVTDARVNLSKVETERAQAAYDYVQALAKLLEATGQPARLVEYSGNADLKLPLPPLE